MSNFLVTPNMNLPNPVPGVDPGPDYANNIQASLSIIDQHNHSSGNGQQIQPNGINLTSDLTFLSNNATNLRSARFTAQTATLALTTDIGCLYVVNNELYYNDVTGGHQVAITSNGSVNAGAGSITGLPSGTASATFSAATFVFQSATSTAANLDAQSVILRNSTASSRGLTLQAPTLASNIVQTLPAIPAATSFMQMDTAGNMSASSAVAKGIVAANIADNTITESQMAPLSIGTPELINASVTQAKRAALGQQKSSDCGSFNVPASITQITNLSVTITTTGRPVFVGFIPSSSSGSQVAVTSGVLLIQIFRDGSAFAGFQMSAPNAGTVAAPGSSVFTIDTSASAASHTYTAKASYTTVSSGNGNVSAVSLFAYEL